MPNNIAIAKLQDKSVSVTSNGSHIISPDQGYTGLHRVSVDVDVVPPGQINFYDYDGTLVVSYTGEEVQALSDLPSAPDHSTDEVPLTFDEWNWTLTNIKSYNTSYPEATIDVGACYHTTDGKTHLIWSITGDNDGIGVLFVLEGTGGSVDWGDGTVDTIENTEVSHIYATAGVYDCAISTTSRSINVDGHRNNSNVNIKYSSKLRKVYLGSSIRRSYYQGDFYYCETLESILIPNTVTGLGAYNFRYDNSLRAVVIPKSITTTSQNIFNGCEALKIVSLPDTITTLGNGLFCDCRALKNITIPSSVTTLEQSSTFSNCCSLKTLIIPDSVTNLTSLGGSLTLRKIRLPSTMPAVLPVYMFNACYSLEEVILPSGITTISSSAFQNCHSLRRITIPDTVTSIGSNAFNACYSLREITIPEGVITINGSFGTCRSLQTVTIPSTVTTISGSYAFSNGNYSLYSVTLLPTTPPTLANSNSFSVAYTKKFYVPYSADHSILNAYKTASNWSTYANYMEELPQS